MSRLVLALALLAPLTLAACDTASDDEALFVPGEVLVDLKDGVGVADFRPYVEADAELEWKGTVAEFVLLGVPEGEEEERAVGLESEASRFVASAQVNSYAYPAGR